MQNTLSFHLKCDPSILLLITKTYSLRITSFDINSMCPNCLNLLSHQFSEAKYFILSSEM